MTTALVTGASGFVGRHLAALLNKNGWQVQGVVRNPGLDTFLAQTLPDLSAAGRALQQTPVDVVFHLAGLAHAGAQGADRDKLFRVNVDQTLELYRQAVAAGVRRFVWLSSIKVLGDTSPHALSIEAPYHPGDDYARSKMIAEQQLLAASSGNTQLQIVRPPLVYGVGVQANFLSLLRVAAAPWPLPLKSASAPRAWVGVHNLCAFLLHLATQSGAEHQQIWHVRDTEQVSVAQMLGQIRELMSRPERLWPFPSKLALSLAKLVGRAEMAQRLFLPLPVDVSETQRLLGWQPPFTQTQELQKVVLWFRTR